MHPFIYFFLFALFIRVSGPTRSIQGNIFPFSSITIHLHHRFRLFIFHPLAVIVCLYFFNCLFVSFFYISIRIIHDATIPRWHHTHNVRNWFARGQDVMDQLRKCVQCRCECSANCWWAEFGRQTSQSYCVGRICKPIMKYIRIGYT